MSWGDLLDVLVISFFVYLVLSWRQQKTLRSILGVVLPLVAVFSAAEALNMYLTATLFHIGLTVISVAVVIIFQEDIRQGVESLLSKGFLFRKTNHNSRQRIQNILTECFSTFSKNKIGALVIVKGRQPLQPHVRGGVAVGGRVSLPLLYSIFDHHSPGHDGAVTIIGHKIDRLGAHLPLSRHPDSVGRLGTRHSAALGLAERCDAFVVCCSEETGGVSIAHEGKIEMLTHPILLSDRLAQFFETMSDEANAKGITEWHWGRKAISFAIALGLWVLFANPLDWVQHTVEVPISYRNLPESWDASAPNPTKVRTVLYGHQSRIAKLDATKLALTVDLSSGRAGKQKLALTSTELALPKKVRVVKFIPSEIQVELFKTVIQQLPVKVVWPPNQYPPPNSSSFVVEPPTIAIRLRESSASPGVIQTEEVTNDELQKAGKIPLRLRLPKDARFPDESLPQVFLVTNP